MLADRLGPSLKLQVEDLEITFDQGPLFAPLSFSIAPREITTIIGPSGVGKTSVLRAVAGVLAQATAAKLSRPARTAMVFQEDRLFPWCDLISNVVVPIELERDLASSDVDLAHELLDQLAMSGQERRKPAEVSGGMRQRVSIARALVTAPDLLLLDEPFAALDFDTKIRAQRTILDRIRQTGAAALLVTHDIDDAVSLSQEIIRLRRYPATWSRETIDWRAPLADPVESRRTPQHFETVRGILADENI